MARTTRKKPEVRIKTTVRMRESLKGALEQEADFSGSSEAAILDFALAKYLRGKGHKGLQLRNLN